MTGQLRVGVVIASGVRFECSHSFVSERAAWHLSLSFGCYPGYSWDNKIDL
jgi:hypothetical protein